MSSTSTCVVVVSEKAMFRSLLSSSMSPFAITGRMLTREGKREDSMRERSLDSSSVLHPIAIDMGLHGMRGGNLPHPHNCLIIDVVKVRDTKMSSDRCDSLSSRGDRDRCFPMKRT